MQMKMEKKVNKFDRNKVKKLLQDENEYIVDLLTILDVPDSVEDETLENTYLLASKKNQKAPTARTERAQTAEELKDRLEIIKNKMKSKKSKASERTLKKREMKKLKKNKEFKKVLNTVHKAMKNEKIKEEKFLEDNKALVKQVKPIFNEDGKIVFSKFDFASHPGAKTKKSRRDKYEKNPKQLLETLKEQKKKITELVEQGDETRAHEIKTEQAWRKVFDKTEGKKVKDDPTLLIRAIKKREDEKLKSKKKWTERKQKIEHEQAAKQKKRQENLDKRIKDKKTRKLKNLSKRGRVIPGF